MKLMLFRFGSLCHYVFIYTVEPPIMVPISVGFSPQFRVVENRGPFPFPLMFGITGTAVDRVPFSLVPLTYQQFEDRTGQSVADVFSGVLIPPPASDGETTE